MNSLEEFVIKVIAHVSDICAWDFYKCLKMLVFLGMQLSQHRIQWLAVQGPINNYNICVLLVVVFCYITTAVIFTCSVWLISAKWSAVAIVCDNDLCSDVSE